MQPVLQSHPPSVLPSTVTFHQRSLPGGTLPGNLRLFGKNVRFTVDRLHKHQDHFSIPLSMNITPKNEKLDLGILQHLEQLLGLGLGWVISAYPPTMNVTPKNEKLDLGIL